MMKYQRFNSLILALAVISLKTMIYGAQIRVYADDLFPRDRLQPVANENVFKTEGYFNWGSSILKGEDGKYHL